MLGWGDPGCHHPQQTQLYKIDLYYLHNSYTSLLHPHKPPHLILPHTYSVRLYSPYCMVYWRGSVWICCMNEQVQQGYLPLTYVVYEMVQLGYLPLNRSGGLCYVGSGCTYVFLYLYMVYVYVMQYLVCMKLNTRPHKFIHQYISHTSQIPIIHHLCPGQPRLFKKQTTSPHIKVLYVLYMAPHLKILLCTPGVFMPHVLCTDILRFVTTNKIPSNLGGRGS